MLRSWVPEIFTNNVLKPFVYSFGVSLISLNSPIAIVPYAVFDNASISQIYYIVLKNKSQDNLMQFT